jgi:hypothetical protein
MPDVTDIQIYRDGGTIEFRVTGSDVDALYQLQTPFAGTPRALLKNTQRLEFGSGDECAVLAILREWLARASTRDILAALAELDTMQVWRNLPQRLSEIIPIHRVRTVIQHLSERCA